MNKNELLKIINDGENSQVEFKLGNITSEELAITIISFLNLQGGIVLLGVNDNGGIEGIQDDIDKNMNTISQICQSKVHPPIIPILDIVHVEDKRVICVTLEKGTQKPYYLIKNEKIVFYIRVGTTSRLASPEQIAILYANHPFVHHDVIPVNGMTSEYIDERRVRNYFLNIRKLSEKTYNEQKENLCINSRIMKKVGDSVFCTLAGALLFGNQPGSFVPSAGLGCVAFEGKTKDYQMLDKKFYDAPLFSYEKDGITMEHGILELSMQFVKSNTKTRTKMVGIKREEFPQYPKEVLREAITNALIHRDYSLQGGQIQLLIFSDRIEIHSPGRLPNTLSIDMIKNGASYARNPVLVKFAENFGYVEHLGLGIPEKIIKPMIDMGYKAPEFIDTGYEFIVILRSEI